MLPKLKDEIKSKIKIKSKKVVPNAAVLPLAGFTVDMNVKVRYGETV
jgi:hypothetical protein